MSTYGSPGSLPSTKPTPPQRGSFPLDHEGECKNVMTSYLSCIRKVKGVNDDACRELAKSYLGCRMDRNLMARDEFKNLGFRTDTSEAGSTEQQQQQQQQGGSRKGSAEGSQGELRW